MDAGAALRAEIREAVPAGRSGTARCLQGAGGPIGGHEILFALDNLPEVPRGLAAMEDLLIPFFRLDAPEFLVPAPVRRRQPVDEAA